MLDDHIQQEAVRDAVELERALSNVVNKEIRQQNQQRISSIITSAMNAIKHFKRFCSANPRTQKLILNGFHAWSMQQLWKELVIKSQTGFDCHW